MNTLAKNAATRLAWWENFATTHTDLRAAVAAAVRRSRDVDEDVGVVPPIALPQPAVSGGLIAATAAAGVVVGGPYLRSHSRGWEIAPGKTLDMRHFLGRQQALTDIVAESLPGAERVLLHVTGPWTFGATVEYRGHPLCFDRPAFRDVSLALGEGVRELCDALGVEVVHVHEPRLPEVISTLIGATEFETMHVDRDIAINVERRFIDQVTGAGQGRAVALDAGCTHPELLSSGAQTLVVDTLDDDVARLIDAGAKIALALGRRDSEESLPGTPELTAESIAREVIAAWKRWTFDTQVPQPQIDLVASAGKALKPGQAAERARIVREAASLLYRN